MSYILEALKKAEAERRSGLAHAVPLPPGFPGAERQGGAPQARRWLGIAATLTVALPVVTWLAMRESAPQAEAGSAAAPLPVTAAVMPEAPVVAPVTPPAAATAPESAVAAPTQEKPISAKPAKKKPEKKSPAPASAVAAAAPKESGIDVAVATLNDLPAQVRNEIPLLTIGGYIYAGNRADRSVLINNRLLREGDEIAPGFTLEQMTRDSMILNYKGYRYRASY